MKLSFNTLLFAFGTLLAFSLAAPVPSDTSVESRQLLPIAIGIAAIAIALPGIISSLKKDDKITRENFTQNVVSALHDQNPDLNYVVVHVAHNTVFPGEKGVDWGHSHEEVDIKIGGTIGYEIYWFKSGTFTRLGDGGFINWAFNGQVESKSDDGRTIVFS